MVLKADDNVSGGLVRKFKKNGFSTSLLIYKRNGFLKALLKQDVLGLLEGEGWCDDYSSGELGGVIL